MKKYNRRFSALSALKEDSKESRELAFNRALKYLSYRPRSVKEVYNYLSKKNLPDDTINKVLKKLIDLRFLNDAEFAKLWIESRQKHKGKSKFVIKNELRLKGLNDDLIEPLLAQAQDDFETARNLFERKKEKMKNLTREEFIKKMGGFLQRKGFSWEIISKLLREN